MSKDPQGVLERERVAQPTVQVDIVKIADETVNDWAARGMMPDLAWNFRGLVCAGIHRFLGEVGEGLRGDKAQSADAVQPKVGETWFVKINGGLTLAAFEVLEVTPCTVRVKKPGSHGSYSDYRYERSDLRFVERMATDGRNG